MRIIDLLEDINFDETEFVNKAEGGIDYDLAEDLTFFMNNDDDVYRRAVYPAVVKCAESFKQKNPCKPSVFRNAALESYRAYTEKYPIRSLPSELGEDICNEVCELMYKEIQEALAEKDGKE